MSVRLNWLHMVHSAGLYLGFIEEIKKQLLALFFLRIISATIVYTIVMIILSGVVGQSSLTSLIVRTCFTYPCAQNWSGAREIAVGWIRLLGVILRSHRFEG